MKWFPSKICVRRLRRFIVGVKVIDLRLDLRGQERAGVTIDSVKELRYF